MIDALVEEMATLFKKGVFTKSTSYRFSFDDTTFSITVDAESFAVEKGAGAGEADCSCKTSEAMFKKIWYDGYKPGMMDFLGGAIKCDDPFKLPLFLRAFGKEPV